MRSSTENVPDLAQLQVPIEAINICPFYDQRQDIQPVAPSPYLPGRERKIRLNAKIKRRVEYELGVIEQLGFAECFLVVWDVAREARRHGIHYAGRGSTADSAVAYCLYITDVDAIATT